jgi:hypothetical protein
VLVIGAVIGAVAGVRSFILQRDQRSFDARYGPGRSSAGD